MPAGARGDPPAARTAAVVIMIASTVSCLRVLVAVAVVAPEFLSRSLLPVGVLMALDAVAARGVCGSAHRRQPVADPAPAEPHATPLGHRVRRDVRRGVVGPGGGQVTLGGHGLYAVAGLSGLTEMDAITLSTARLSLSDPRSPPTAGG